MATPGKSLTAKGPLTPQRNRRNSPLAARSSPRTSICPFASVLASTPKAYSLKELVNKNKVKTPNKVRFMEPIDMEMEVNEANGSTTQLPQTPPNSRRNSVALDPLGELECNVSPLKILASRRIASENTYKSNYEGSPSFRLDGISHGGPTLKKRPEYL